LGGEGCKGLRRRRWEMGEEGWHPRGRGGEGGGCKNPKGKGGAARVRGD
jgi:hypothetical protein